MAGAQILRQSLMEGDSLKPRMSGEKPDNNENAAAISADFSQPTAEALEKPSATAAGGSSAEYQLPPMLFLIRRMFESPKAASAGGVRGDQGTLDQQINATVENKGVSALFLPYSLTSVALHEASLA
jgi:hypothetical protein